MVLRCSLDVRGGFLHVNASSIAWLRQEAISGSGKTVYDEAVSQMPDARPKGMPPACFMIFMSAKVRLGRSFEALAAAAQRDQALAALQAANGPAEKLTAAYEEVCGHEIHRTS